MSNKINLSEKRKQFLKQNFDKLNKEDLKKDEQRYFQLILNGKNRLKRAVRFEGKFISGEVVEISKKIAEKKGISVQRYFDDNKEAVRQYIESGFTELSKNPERAIDVLRASNKRHVLVNDGNGLVRVPRNEAILRLALFEQHIKTNSNVVYMETNVRVYSDGKLQVTIPVDFQNYEGDELIDYLDEFDELTYVESSATGEG